jgi:hypothetical protein
VFDERRFPSSVIRRKEVPNVAAKKATVKAGANVPIRDRAESPRRHYLVTTVTQKEKEAIQKYCDERQISVSAFLADVALEDAQRSTKKLEDQEITITLKLPARDIDKMRIFARLEEKSVEDLLRQLLQPSFQKRQTVTALEMHTLRCWLSDEEHRIIKKYLAKHRLSARNYLSLLALKAINKQ